MKNGFTLVAFIAVSIALAGCATLPRRSYPGEGVLVIAVEHLNETGEEYFGNYKLTVKKGDQRHALRTLGEGRSLVAVAVPAGGRCSLETEFWYESGPRARAGTFHQRPSTPVGAGELVINDHYIQVSYVDNDDGTRTMRRDWYPLTEAMRGEIVERITTDANFQYWTLRE